MIIIRQSLAAYAATGFDAVFFMQSMKKQLTEQIGKQGNEGGADEGHTAAGHELLHTLGLSAGVIVAVAFKQIDRAPNAKTGTESDNKSLKDTDSGLKKCHIHSNSQIFRLPS